MNLTERIKNIITNPNPEWNVIAGEQTGAAKIITGYVVPLAGLSAIAAFIGYGLIGVSYFGFRMNGLNWGLYQALTVLLGAIIYVYVSAMVIDLLAPNFNSEKNFNRSVQLVAYASTPAWIGGLSAIFPPLAVLGSLFGFYGLYLMYLGLPKLKGTPEDKRVTYFVLILAVVIVVFMVVGSILASVFMGLFGLSYGRGILH